MTQESYSVEKLDKDLGSVKSVVVVHVMLNFVLLVMGFVIAIISGCTDGRSRAIQERLDGYIKATNHSFDTVNQRLEKLEWKRVKE